MSGGLCLYAEGDDGIAGACSARGEPDHGVVGLGEVRADGRYVLSLVGPDDVEALTVRDRVLKPTKKLVSVELPSGTTVVALGSTNGNCLLAVNARRP